MVVYEIAGVTIRLELPCPLSETKSFAGYRAAEDAEVDVRLVAERVAQLNIPAALPIHEAEDMRIYRDDTGFVRCFFNRKDNVPYALLREEAPGRMRLRYPADKQEYFLYPGSFFHCMGLEWALLHGGAFILHASYLETPAGALLFSGPSGIGKSTQASLWEQHGGARLVNGDRVALRLDNGIVHACGLPYAGSSHCFRNVTLPVCAIVRLEQAASNTARRISPAAAFRYLYEQTTVNLWDTDAVERVTGLVAAVCERVPVYHLACTKEPNAVTTLNAALAADNIPIL